MKETQQTLWIDHSPTMTVADTRAQAHEKIKPTRHQLHIRLIKDFYEREFNADAWAVEHGMSVLSVRPRVSELNKAELLHRTRYGLSVEGNNQDVFTLFPYLKDRMAVLIVKYGMDRAAEEIIKDVK